MTAPHPRTARPGAWLRTLRAAVFAAVCVVLAAAGHTLASCARVPLWTLGAGFLGCLLLVAPLAGRVRSLPAIAALLTLGQVVLHGLFGLGQHGAAAVAAGPATADGSLSDTALVARAAQLLCGSAPSALTPGHAYRLLLDARLIDASSRTTGAMPASHHMAGMAPAGSPAGLSDWTTLLPSLPMLLGHVLAAVATGWLLRRGDLAVLRLIELSAHGVAEAALVRSLRGALALVHALCAGLLPAVDAGPRARRGERDDVPAPHTTALQHSVIRRGPPAAAFLLAA
ncbi:hypothetical protein NX794_10495 [Streptomyces sp. LP11]|uniref:Integral membrane protein n=1 Tax=Streptomyces pyxinicus TaxID=2970331 RepID=A0ABT2AZR0_9ACTN|nr:hypothetical protein [Streptomyces sp. LP11]MCS0601640.1 hypothetical protein [Streptomyces sp. LP11]